MNEPVELRPAARTAMSSIDAAPRGERLATGQFPQVREPEVAIWVTSSRAQAGQISLPGHGVPLSLSFDASGERLAITSSDGQAFIAATAHPIPAPMATGMDFVDEVRFARAAPHLLVIGTRTELWSAPSGSVLWRASEGTSRRRPEDPPVAAAVSANGRLIATCTPGELTVQLHQLGDYSIAGVLDGAPAAARFLHFDLHGRFLAAIGWDLAEAYLWDVTLGRLVSPPELVDAFADFCAVALDDSGDLAAFASASGLVTVVDTASGALAYEERVLRGRVADLSFLPGSRVLATACEDGIARLINLA